MRAIALAALLISIAISAAGTAPLTAQTTISSTYPATATVSGHLVVWRVVAQSAPRPVVPASLSPQVNSQTAGSFGQPASTAGSTAGDVGQTAGSFGQTSSSTGQTAGSAGQTVGSFGESLSTLAPAAARKNGSSPQLSVDPDWDRFTGGVNLPLNIAYKEVGIDDLEARLQDTADSNDAPDVLVGTPLPSAWSNQGSGLVRRFGLVTLGDVGAIAIDETPASPRRSFRVEASILRAAPNPAAARAYVLWVYGKRPCEGLCDGHIRSTPELQGAIDAARSALFEVLNGQGGLAADRQAAAFNTQLAQQAALNVHAPALLTNLSIHIDTMEASANSRLAVVALEAMVEGKECFGVVYSYVVLRSDDAGQWRVLQITPNLPPEQHLFARRILSAYASTVAPDAVAKVLGASQAAPIDGDNREASPELWWDNGGGATLEIIEWQRKAADSWTNSNLFFVPDDGGHLRTRVTGRFADLSGPYRWRIWALGRGGVVVISSWRALNILPR